MHDRPVASRPMQRHTRNTQLTECEAKGASGVCFFNAARQRTAAANTHTICVGKIGPGKRSNRENQRIVFRQRLDLGSTTRHKLAGNEKAP